MKQLKEFINEKLHVGKYKKYKYFPKTKEELQNIINKRIEKEGNECDLNDIDVSQITDMSKMFDHSEFNGDISNWNVSNVTNMYCMFGDSEFNGDISNWNVSNVTNMNSMFRESEFRKNKPSWYKK